MNTPSEFLRITLSARIQGEPSCVLELAEGMRPEPEPEPEEPEVEGEKGDEGTEQAEGYVYITNMSKFSLTHYHTIPTFNTYGNESF